METIKDEEEMKTHDDKVRIMPPDGGKPMNSEEVAMMRAEPSHL